MATPVDLARGWMQKGDSDRINADRTVQTTGPYDTACFHAQQAAEKCLKAILALARLPIPRTHDLEDIYDECIAVAANEDLPCLHLERPSGVHFLRFALTRAMRRALRAGEEATLHCGHPA